MCGLAYHLASTSLPSLIGYGYFAQVVQCTLHIHYNFYQVVHVVAVQLTCKIQN